MTILDVYKAGLVKAPTGYVMEKFRALRKGDMWLTPQGNLCGPAQGDSFYMHRIILKPQLKEEEMGPNLPPEKFANVKSVGGDLIDVAPAPSPTIEGILNLYGLDELLEGLSVEFFAMSLRNGTHSQRTTAIQLLALRDRLVKRWNKETAPWEDTNA